MSFKTKIDFSELNQCPLCGNKPVIQFDEKEGWCVRCEECNLKSPAESSFIDAKIEWNKKTRRDS